VSSLQIVVASTGFVGVRDRVLEAFPDAELAMIDEAALRRDGAAADVLVPAMSRVDGALMDCVCGLRLIQQWGVGLEGVDVAAATARGLPVARAPSAGSGNAESVAEWCVMAAIALSRRLAQAEREIRRGGAWGAPMGQALLGRRAGIVGMGGLGEALAIRLRPFGLRMAGIARRAHPELAERLGMDWVGPLDRLPDLLRVSDYLFLCLPLTEETRRLIDSAALAQLPEGACLINVGHGGVVDHSALLAALDSGRLLGAGLDVFDQEPLDPNSPLLTRPNVLATPHVAGVTDASYRGIAERVTANIRRLANGERLEDCVNWEAIHAGR
jgi:phosphoglycerate dehydrogenase-like enzyme